MTTTQPSDSVTVLLSRTFWIMLGPLLLLVLVVSIARHGTSWLTALDVLFFAVLGGVLLARWLEFRGGNPQTATGEPATPADLQKYVWITLAMGVGAWVVANVLGNHWLG